MRKMIMLLAVAICSLATVAFAAETTIVGFDGGSDGGFTGNAYFESEGGNPGGVAHHEEQLFFNELRTGAEGEPANEAFLGDYSTYESITFSIDVMTNSLTDFIGNPISRSIGISLKDRDIQGGSGASGVYYELGILSGYETGEWTTLSVTIDNPTSADLPAGWVGFGDEDPSTYMPILPPGASFATVLASVDELDITGAAPGYFYTYANFDVMVDNITVIVEEGGVATYTKKLSGVKAMYR